MCSAHCAHILLYTMCAHTVMYQTHSMSIFSLCQILSRLLLLTWAHLRNAFAPSHLSSITSASIFAPSSERTSHILTIVCHFIALFEPMLVRKGSRLFALITFCWHFQFLPWFVLPCTGATWFVSFFAQPRPCQPLAGEASSSSL